MQKYIMICMSKVIVSSILTFELTAVSKVRSLQDPLELIYLSQCKSQLSRIQPQDGGGVKAQTVISCIPLELQVP